MCVNLASKQRITNQNYKINFIPSKINYLKTLLGKARDIIEKRKIL